MDTYVEQNAQAWGEVGRRNIWTDGCTQSKSKAHKGELDMVLSPFKKVPHHGSPAYRENVLALASGGGQQGVLMSLAEQR